MLIGNFNNDQLNGHCIVFLNNQTYVIGSFVRGLLDGQFILRSDQFTVYWIVKMNKVCGEIVVINYESMKARVWLIESNFFSFIIRWIRNLCQTNQYLIKLKIIQHFVITFLDSQASWNLPLIYCWQFFLICFHWVIFFDSNSSNFPPNSIIL